MPDTMITFVERGLLGSIYIYIIMHCARMHYDIYACEGRVHVMQDKRRTGTSRDENKEEFQDKIMECLKSLEAQASLIKYTVIVHCSSYSSY